MSAAQAGGRQQLCVRHHLLPTSPAAPIPAHCSYNLTGIAPVTDAAAPQPLRRVWCAARCRARNITKSGGKKQPSKKKKENARSSHSLPPATDSGSRSVPHFGSRVPPARTLCLHPPRSLPPPRLSVRPCGAPPGGGMMEPAGGPGEQSVGGGGGAWGVCGNPPHPERG